MKMLRPLLPALIALAPAGALAAKFEVYPEQINLTFKTDKQTLVVRTTEANGVQRDITSEAKLSIVDPAKAKVTGRTLTPIADGETALKVEWKGESIQLPIKVEKADTAPSISFRNDVMPVFMKAECNRCHGAARGQDGFRLSLWGFDPEGDHFRITREQPGRRINLAVPEASLMLTKSDGSAPHTGGKRFEKGSPLYNTILHWLQAGAPNDPADLPTLTGVELLPNRIVLDSDGSKFKMVVRAKYSDGSDRDVTDIALFLSNNEGTAKLGEDGTVSTGQRGEAFVMARYGKYTVGSQVIVVPKGQKYEWPKLEEKNYVDTLVHKKLQDLRLVPSGLCDDPTFARRAYIDINGVLPTSEQVEEFVNDKDASKREKLVDRLIARHEFVDVWALKWSELLQIATNQQRQMYYKSVISYYSWIKEQLDNNLPLNEIAARLLSANGSNFEYPAANFFLTEPDPLKHAEDTAQAFFGIRIQCAQCHNHPFDRWTMEDYRGFVSFFTQVGRKNGEDPRERVVYNSRAGEAKHPVGDVVVPPKFLGGEAPQGKDADRRQLLADWVRSKDNPWFAKHMANLVWAQYIGRGIVEPVDDVRISNPASNPELLQALADKLVSYNFDLRKIVRDVCTSRTYQLSTRPNETNELDTRNFSHGTIRRMRAEVMYDCISQVTESPTKHKGLPIGARSVEMADGKSSNYFLTTFGRSTREAVCSREEVAPTLSQALHLLNGDTIEGKIAGGQVVEKLLKDGKNADDIIVELFVRCFARKPTNDEITKLKSKLPAPTADNKPAPETKLVLQDVFWALMNSKEFLFNH